MLLAILLQVQIWSHIVELVFSTTVNINHATYIYVYQSITRQCILHFYPISATCLFKQSITAPVLNMCCMHVYMPSWMASIMFNCSIVTSPVHMHIVNELAWLHSWLYIYTIKCLLACCSLCKVIGNSIYMYYSNKLAVYIYINIIYSV